MDRFVGFSKRTCVSDESWQRPAEVRLGFPSVRPVRSEVLSVQVFVERKHVAAVREVMCGMSSRRTGMCRDIFNKVISSEQ